LNHTPTILIVDDNATNAELLYEILKESYDVLVALDGPFALETAKEELPDLILLDVMMPKMDGYEVCRKLKEDPETAQIPVIFITACQDETNLSQIHQSGAFGFISKPIDFSILFDQMHQALQQPIPEGLIL
jgi:putative two-component system response regulator